MKRVLVALLLLTITNSYAQSYADSMQTYISGYVKDHEVVKDEDKKFMQFFPIDPDYRVTAKFEKTANNNWFYMGSSGNERKLYRVFGKVSFSIHDTMLSLNIYQSQSLINDPDYKDYLLLLFTDKTTGNESYEGGRYLDFMLTDIKNNSLVIDFNKAYNPYCAYEKNKFNCPIPPKENNLELAIRAGEKAYLKDHN